MDPVKKIKNRRGMTLVEVLIVVALMAILLGIAVPNLIREAQRIKMAELNGDARAVAVAVQSKLYGMKNAATSSEVSSFGLFNQTAASETDIHPTSDPENLRDVMYVSNFAQNTEDEAAVDKANAGKALLLSGALTDAQLLEEGKVLVFYTADTADVLEVFYSEEPFDIQIVTKLLEENQLVQDYLDQYRIGHYFGYGAEEPGRLEGMPLFTCNWIWDDELRLQIQMLTEPSPELLDKGLGMEVYLQFPALDGSSGKTEEMMIYAEGIFATNYVTGFVRQSSLNYGGSENIIQEDAPITFQEIRKNGNSLYFALDSLVNDRVINYDGARMRKYLYHQQYPTSVSVTKDLLFPRESIANWTDPTTNPFITVWFRQHRDAYTGWSDSVVSNALFDLWDKSYINGANRTPTNYVNVDEYISLHVKLYVLETDANGEYITMPEWGTRTDGHYQGAGDARLRKPAESLRAVDIYSHPVSPYYYLLTENGQEIALTSMRDLSNLSYVFNGVENGVTTARLDADITGDQFYKTLKNVREAVLNANNCKENEWPLYTVAQQTSVDAIDLYKPFTIDGTMPDGKGSYKIQNVAFTVKGWGSDGPEPGGLFEYARDCTFTNIDIVNPRVWRRLYTANLFKTEDKNVNGINEKQITSIEVDTVNGGPSGALVGVAVNCSFKNIRTYIDDKHIIDSFNPLSSRICGTIEGGLVGLAIGGKDEQDSNLPEFQNNNTTTFENCAAAVRLAEVALDAGVRVIYAGGLVGIAMGDVQIKNSYAACLLSSYYSGGLVGATITSTQELPVTWSFQAHAAVNGELFKGNGTVVGTAPTITNSFSAGQIGRRTRIGAGLIADVRGNTPNVEGCYSAAWWEVLSPIAYGTFKGDTTNFYVYQTRFPVPVTGNVDAWFQCTGDVFSLQSNEQSGIACTLNGLNNTLMPPSSTAATYTKAEHTYAYTGGMIYSWWDNYWGKYFGNPDDSASYKSPSYPFPMPRGNTQFFGVWIVPKAYVEGDTSAAPGTPTSKDFSSKFLGFYGVNYMYTDPELRNDIYQVISKKDSYDSTQQQFIMEDKGNDAVLSITVAWPNGASEDEDGTHTFTAKNLDSSLWWAKCIKSLGLQDIVGWTSARVGNGGKYEFYGPKFYDPEHYNPFTGYTFVPTGEGIDLGGTTGLLWDYYGFYCLATRNNNDNSRFDRYYVKFATGDKLQQLNNLPTGKNAIKDSGFIFVNEKTFTEATGYTTYTFNKNSDNVRLEWDSKQGFHAKSQGEGGGK